MLQFSRNWIYFNAYRSTDRLEQKYQSVYLKNCNSSSVANVKHIHHSTETKPKIQTPVCPHMKRLLLFCGILHFNTMPITVCTEQFEFHLSKIGMLLHLSWQLITKCQSRFWWHSFEWSWPDRRFAGIRYDSSELFWLDFVSDNGTDQ